MEELEVKIQDVLDSVNETFDVAIEDSQDVDSQKIITKIVLKNIKNDGSDFVEKFCSLFGPFIETVSNGEKELVFEEEKGLTIKKTK